MTDNDLSECYQVGSYSSFDAGYPVISTFQGNSRVASFVCDSEAEYFAKHANKMLNKHNTTDMSQWK